jgi:HEAT repeat protein
VQICPACFAILRGAVDRCTACGAKLERFSKRDYRDKLISALAHPLADVRMRVIIALGLRGETESADPLLQCALRYPADVVAALEIVRSLALLNDADARQEVLSRLARRHPAHAVRLAAENALQDAGEEDADH